MGDMEEGAQISYILPAANKCPAKLLCVHFFIACPSVHPVYREHRSWTHRGWGTEINNIKSLLGTRGAHSLSPYNITQEPLCSISPRWHGQKQRKEK